MATTTLFPDTQQQAATMLCRFCGALHRGDLPRCDACGRESALVKLLAVEHHKDHGGVLVSCLSCGQTGRPTGGGYREPARPVRVASAKRNHAAPATRPAGKAAKRRKK